MMKKLLVLSLVLAVSAMSSAALSLIPTAPDSAVLSGSGYAGGTIVYVGIIGTEVSWDQLYAGSQYGAVDASAIAADFAALFGTPVPDLVIEFTLADATAPPATILPNGNLVGFIAMAPVTIYAFDANTGDAAVGNGLTIIPEPMTMGLLGLGALFLRKRK